MDQPLDQSKAGSKPPESRRGFLVSAAAVVIGGIVALVPLAAGLLTLFDPLRRKGGTGGFLRVTTLDALPSDGVPRRFAVLSDRTDAWNLFANEPIGAVYLRRTSADKVEALNSICPHAGCFVDFNKSADCYKCPCHNSTFKLDGEIIQPSPSPRPMDSLAVELRDHGDTKEVWVRFENFYPGIAAKVPKA
jgi:Rieske Fe-S protein